MIAYLANKTQFRADILKERGQLARRSLRRRLGLDHSYKVNSSAPSALLGDLCAFAVKNSSMTNFAWVHHMLHHLATHGSMALLLANGSMSSNSSGEGDIRRASNFCKHQLN